MVVRTGRTNELPPEVTPVTSTPYTPRHGAARRRLVVPALPGGRTAIKSMAGFGLLVGTGTVAAGASTPDPAVAAANPGSAEHQTSDAEASALLSERGTTQTSSRSTARTAVTAAPAAAPAANTLAGAGVVEITAEAKPKPKAPKKATETSDDKAAPSAASPDAPTAPAPGDPGKWAAAGRALGLQPNGVLVYAAVRENFPSITSIGGLRPGDPLDHGSGHAVDIMCNFAEGDAIAAYMQANAGSLGIKYIIWKQRIWFPGGSWRMMADRGSPTQNHMDHVHVSVH